MSKPSTESANLALQTLADICNELTATAPARTTHERLAEVLTQLVRLDADYSALTLPAFGDVPSGNQLAIDA